MSSLAHAIAAAQAACVDDSTVWITIGLGIATVCRSSLSRRRWWC